MYKYTWARVVPSQDCARLDLQTNYNFTPATIELKSSSQLLTEHFTGIEPQIRRSVLLEYISSSSLI